MMLNIKPCRPHGNMGRDVMNPLQKKVSRARKVQIWISYDMGSKGDFTNLYKWLKSYEALECGNSTAMIYFSKQRGKKLIPSLKKELEESIDIAQDTRIFIIYKGHRGSLKSQWLYGAPNLKPAWANFSPA